MRKLPSLKAGAAIAIDEFNNIIHLSETDTNQSPPPYPAPSSSTKCDARKCPWWPYTNSTDFKANTALILVILFCALICAMALNAAVRYMIKIHCIRRRNHDDDQIQDADHSSKAEVEDVMQEEADDIAAVIYTEGMKMSDDAEECIICLSEFVIGDKIRVLEKCKHGFHVQCIQKWLIMHSSCPTCRTNICTVLDSDSDVTPQP